MKHYWLLLFVLIYLLILSCKNNSNGEDSLDYRQEMRDLVKGISHYAAGYDEDFIVIPQNGHELLTVDGEEDGEPDGEYIYAISGVGREDMFYGYDQDNEITPLVERDYMLAFMDIAENNNVQVLTSDYCWTHAYMDSSYKWNFAKGYISFAAEHRELDNIPEYPDEPYAVNNANITSLSSARNFLYLLNTVQFSAKQVFLDSLQQTNYDLMIIDLFYNDSSQFSLTDISYLKIKNNGGSRLVIAYMSIGEAEDYRYYWKNSWKTSPPSWLAGENPDWERNYKVKYWKRDWKNIIYGNDESYLKKIIEVGFDGVYLDIIDAFEYFE